MKRILLLISLFIVLLPYCSSSQEYSYTHYDIAEGLAGSTVYCITQDKDGFIWTGTETGVSRFDGTHFRNYTTKDGLPDVEILEMFADSRGRVWMAPFRKSLCYYFKGKIYNQENDSILHSIHLNRNIEHFAEDAAGNILIQESNSLQMLTNKGEVIEIDSIHGRHIAYCHGVSRSRSGQFLVTETDTAYELDPGQFTPLFPIQLYELPKQHTNFFCLSPDIIVWRSGRIQNSILSLRTGELSYFPFGYDHYRHVSFSVLNDSSVCSNESSGSTVYDIHTGRTKRFLPGIEVSRSYQDDEGNVWFTTLGQGLYRLNSYEFRNIRLQQQQYYSCSVHSIKRIGNELFVGSSRNSIFRFVLPDLRKFKLLKLDSQERNRVGYINKLSNGREVYGADNAIEFHEHGRLQSYIDMNVKGACVKNERELLVASYNGAFLLDLVAGRILDTLWKERTTAIYYRKDTTYIGTLNGLYMMTGDHQTRFLGKEIPFLRKRIAAIVESRAGVLWIASYDDAGIVAIKDRHVIRAIGRAQGLTSDISRTLTLQNDFLWVGTDKGLNKIDLNHPEQPIVQYTSGDGLGSDVINTIYVDSPMVYVGTPAGLSYFDETRVSGGSVCRISWLDITCSGNSRIGDSSHLLLPYQENNIRFDFAGISYSSAGNITYQYRLRGLDAVWRYTKETFLDYPTLPAGTYDLEVVAINKFRVRSRPLFLHFIVAAPFWKTAWFYSAVFIVLVSLAWMLVSMRIKRLRLRQREERQLARKVSELEHMALQAQMNPHFIFNCLNSIQHYIFDQDILAANKYISGLSRLIRATLQHSSKSFISLSEEISYLSTYLSLEKLRFKEKMNYAIECEEEIDPDAIQIPPMLIQPYVENSMRHGLRHKTDGNGSILIRICLFSDGLTVLIEDNGIGRDRAERYKTAEHIEYQSKGMTLTAERIGLMNSIYGEGIGVEIIDVKDEEGRPAGTRVLMKFPLFAKPLKGAPNDPNRTG